MKKKYKILIKDFVVALIIFCIIISCMYAYTQVWPPLVVIESDSMAHQNAPFGKVGTIDPGDFTFVRRIYDRTDIVTYFQGKRTGYKTYNDYGDVIIFMKNGHKEDTPVIHRAMMWVEVNITGGKLRYDIPELEVYGVEKITITEINLINFDPKSLHSGFVTKGDNNKRCDQGGGILDMYNRPVELIQPDWVIGKSVGEIPWFGLIKLSIDDIRQGTRHAFIAPSDCWIMLGLSLLIILIIPLSIDLLGARVSQKIKNFSIIKKLGEKKEKIKRKISSSKPLKKQ